MRAISLNPSSFTIPSTISMPTEEDEFNFDLSQSYYKIGETSDDVEASFVITPPNPDTSSLTMQRLVQSAPVGLCEEKRFADTAIVRRQVASRSFGDQMECAYKVRQAAELSSGMQEVREMRSLLDIMMTTYASDKQHFAKIIDEKSYQIEQLQKEVGDQKRLTRTLVERVRERDVRNDQTRQELGIAQNALRELRVTVESLEDSLNERGEEVLEERRERARLILENEAIREQLGEQAGTFAERVRELTQRNEGLERTLADIRLAFTNLQSERAEAQEKEAIETERYRADLAQRHEQHSARLEEYRGIQRQIEASITQKNVELEGVEETILSERARKAGRECQKWGAAGVTAVTLGIFPALGITPAVSDIDKPLREAMEAQNQIRYQLFTLQTQKNTIENRINNLQSRIHALEEKIARLDGEDGENSINGEDDLPPHSLASRS